MVKVLTIIIFIATCFFMFHDLVNSPIFSFKSMPDYELKYVGHDLERGDGFVAKLFKTEGGKKVFKRIKKTGDEEEKFEIYDDEGNVKYSGTEREIKNARDNEKQKKLINTVLEKKLGNQSGLKPEELRAYRAKQRAKQILEGSKRGKGQRKGK